MGGDVVIDVDLNFEGQNNMDEAIGQVKQGIKSQLDGIQYTGLDPKNITDYSNALVKAGKTIDATKGKLDDMYRAAQARMSDDFTSQLYDKVGTYNDLRTTSDARRTDVKGLQANAASSSAEVSLLERQRNELIMLEQEYKKAQQVVRNFHDNPSTAPGSGDARAAAIRDRNDARANLDAAISGVGDGTAQNYEQAIAKVNEQLNAAKVAAATFSSELSQQQQILANEEALMAKVKAEATALASIHGFELQGATLDPQQTVSDSKHLASFTPSSSQLSQDLDYMTVYKQLIGLMSETANMSSKLHNAMNFTPEITNQPLIDLRNELEECKEVVKQLQAMGIGPGVKQYDEAISRFQQLQQEYKQALAENQLGSTPSTKGNNQALIDMGIELEELTQRKKEFEAAGYGAGWKEYDQLVARLNQVQSQYRSLDTIVSEGAQAQSDFANRGDAANSNLQNSLARLSNSWSALIRQFSSFSIPNISESIKAGVTNALASLANVGANIINVFAHPVQSVKNLFGTLGNTAKTVGGKIVSAFKGAAKVLGTLGGAVKGVIGKLASLSKATKSAGGSATNGFKQGLMTMLKYGLSIRSMYFAVRKLKSVFSDSFKQMALGVPSVNAQLSAFMTSLNQLKASLATAFQPIASVVLPLLTTLIGYLVSAMNAIGAFFGALTGQGFIYKATAATTDYAASQNKAAGSASKAAKAQDELNEKLADYDDLQVIQKDSSAGGGGGGGGGGGTPQGATYEKETVSSPLADMVKDAWANSDFTAVGELLGTKLRDVLSRVETEIIPKVQELAVKIGLCLGTFINGFVSVPDLAGTMGRVIAETVNAGLMGLDAFFGVVQWEKVGNFIGEGVSSVLTTLDLSLLGKVLAEKFNAIFDVVKGFTKSFDWSGVATNIANGIKSAISTFNWAGNAQSISSFVTNLFNMIAKVIRQVDWQQLGRNIATFVSNIDWTGISSALAGLVGAAFGALFGLVKGALEDSVNAVTDYFTGYIEDAGGNVIEGLWNGIKNALSNVGSWIKTNIFDPFIEAFKEAFGIHSPSTVMTEMGGYIIDGLIEGVKGIWEKIKSFFEEIPSKITGIFSGVGDIFSGILEMLGFKSKSADETVNVNFVAKTSGTGWDTVKDVMKLASDKVTKTFNYGGDLVKQWNGKLKDVWETKTTAITRTFNYAGNLISNWNSTLKTIWDTKAQTVAKTFNYAGNMISNWTNSLKSIWNTANGKSVTKSFSYAGDIISKWSNTISSIWSKSNGTGVTKSFSYAGNIIKTWKDSLSVIWNKGNGSSVTKTFSATLTSGFREVYNLLRSIASNGVAGAASHILGFTVPNAFKNLPRLATGAVIPPNREFLAMLGDQKHGTNIETPLDTMIEAFTTALDARGGGGMPSTIVIQMPNGKVLAETVWDEESKYYKQTGKYRPSYI